MCSLVGTMAGLVSNPTALAAFVRLCAKDEPFASVLAHQSVMTSTKINETGSVPVVPSHAENKEDDVD